MYEERIALQPELAEKDADIELLRRQYQIVRQHMNRQMEVMRQDLEMKRQDE